MFVLLVRFEPSIKRGVLVACVQSSEVDQVETEIRTYVSNIHNDVGLIRDEKFI